MKRTLALAMILGIAAWSALAAAGAGGPSPGLSFGSSGVADRSGTVRYVTLPAGHGTVVEAVDVTSGQVLRWTYLAGTYGVPAVAWDGSTGGLSAQGQRLVLSSWPGYAKHGVTRFVVLDPKTLKVRRQLLLHGGFAFDALSPTGSVMYLIQFLGSPSSGRYAVRALNVSAGRLYPGAIVDRREPDEKMTGNPVTRTGNGRGSWAYTLYSRGSEVPFVHALDTVHRRAFCIDLRVKGWSSWIGDARMRLSADGKTLMLRYEGETVARVDTKTLKVSG
jgi:hypothetical protein